MKLFIFFLNFHIGFVVIAQDSNLGEGYEFLNNGKIDTVLQEEVYLAENILKSVKIANADQIQDALNVNQQYFGRSGSKSYFLQNELRLNSSSFESINNQVFQDDSLDLSKFKLYKLKGEDSKGSVHYTSYYIPIIEVSSNKDSIYKYPIYKKPKSSYLNTLTRVQIDEEKKLANKGLELAYAKSYFDLFSMMVQGSGYVKYPDGSVKLFSYGGKNQKPYYSIGRYLVDHDYVSSENLSLNVIDNWFQKNPDSTHIFMLNKSYVFFQPSNKKPSGAIGLPLIPKASVAADFKYLPKGSVLLGMIPVLDENKMFSHHEYHILFVHDTGGAIKGPGHIDLYAGVGEQGREYASAMHHYGQLWVILPK